MPNTEGVASKKSDAVNKRCAFCPPQSPNPLNISKKIDPYCENEYWEWIKSGKEIRSVPYFNDTKTINKPQDCENQSSYLKVVCISDTHEKLDQVVAKGIPDGDVLIHAGDFVNNGNREKIIEFNEILGKLPHRHKLVVAGNHELGFDPYENEEMRSASDVGLGTARGYELLTNAKCLHAESYVIDGVTFYGASYHPLMQYPFYTPRGQHMKYVWSKIPNNTDVLITHTPPLGYLDTFTSCWGPERWGCRDLLEQVEKIEPKFHVFGHVHEMYGALSNGRTIFINAAQCEKDNSLGNHTPIVFYIPKKE